jgi:hypothetical protein
MTRSPGDGEKERRKRSVCGRGDQQQTRPKRNVQGGGGDVPIGVSAIGPVRWRSGDLTGRELREPQFGCLFRLLVGYRWVSLGIVRPNHSSLSWHMQCLEY